MELVLGRRRTTLFIRERVSLPGNNFISLLHMERFSHVYSTVTDFARFLG